MFLIRIVKEYRWENFLINGLDPSEKFNKNSLFCENSKTYINRAFVCHPKINCSTKNDENIKEYCSREHFQMFTCSESKEKIYFFQVCNHIHDCSDGSDELLCGKYKGENSVAFAEMKSLNE